MSEPMEVPEEAVGMASAAYYRAVGMVLDEATRLEQIGVLGAMRAALVAARPYLMPTREAITDVIQAAFYGSAAPALAFEREESGKVADSVLALLNGEIPEDSR